MNKMKLKTQPMIILVFLNLILLSCGGEDAKNSNNQENEKAELVEIEPIVYNVIGENIVIRVGPGENFEKLINKKATEALGETHYALLDYTTEVIVEQSNGEWSKIKVVKPEWLSRSHVGWIPTKNIIEVNQVENKKLKNLKQDSYEIIKTDHNTAVENFYVLIKFSEFDKDIIFDFINRFRNQHCERKCNIMVYDTISVSELISKNPIEGKDYIELADHFIALSSFENPNIKSWYPFQDILYKEYGGSNWKKKELK